MYASRFFLFIIPIRINKINRSGEKFIKPSVIISNHQSLIDFPMVFSLTPKLIVLTNDWVMNSKLFGKVSKYADFHSASSGIEANIKKFSEKINEGYSIMIFPEGTRSETSEIKRFHKGAFYIAERLNIDIVPVLIQGTGFFLKKNEILGTSQRVSMEIFERIAPDDGRFGSNYSDRTKSVCKLYRERQKEVVKKYGIPPYLKKNLINNYLYKGPVLEWYLKAKLKFENNYNLFNDYAPVEGSITDIGCGYGFLCYLLSFVSDKRKITGIDHDEEKIKVANNCYSKNKNINFVCADITNYKFDKSDVFFISDVLHYFPEEQQEKLIVNCLNNLNDNGLVIIRDANREMKKRHFVTILTEIFSTRFGFNKVNNEQKKLFFTSKEKVLSIVSNYNVDVEVIDNTRLTSNIVFIIKKKSE